MVSTLFFVSFIMDANYCICRKNYLNPFFISYPSFSLAFLMYLMSFEFWSISLDIVCKFFLISNYSDNFSSGLIFFDSFLGLLQRFAPIFSMINSNILVIIYSFSYMKSTDINIKKVLCFLLTINSCLTNQRLVFFDKHQISLNFYFPCPLSLVEAH